MDLSKAIDGLASGKALGSDGIPPDLIKHCKTTLLLPLHVVLCQCWQEGSVPQDTRDAKIITLYKNKGERSDCNNYRGISLFSVVGKVFARVILIHLQRLAEQVYPESQCGFRAGRSTADMIFSLRQLQKCREQNMPLYVAFIDLTKAFDMIGRDGLFKVLQRIGCPPKLQNLIESFHSNMKGTVQFNGGSSESFWHSQWCQTRLCPCSHTLWDLLRSGPEARFRQCNGSYIPADKIRWRALQPRPPQSQD